MLTKDLKDVFKDAQEVTSLSNTDKIVVITSDGVPKKIDKAVLTDTLTFAAQANTWYQILVSSNNSASVGTLCVASMAPEQEAFSLDWCISRSGAISRSDLNIFNPPMGEYLRSVMSKLRIRRPDSSGYSFYIDLFVTKQRNITVKLVTSINAVLSLEANPQIGSSYSLTEYDLTVVGGGG